MDYTLERHLPYKESVDFIQKRRGFAIGNGIVFMLCLLIPFIGIIIVLPLSVTAFKFKVPGAPSVTCSGNRLNSQAKSALRKAKRGASVQIFDIKSKSSGPRIKPASPIIIELSN